MTRCDWPLDFRWRPHPTELPDLVRRAYTDLDDIELSQGRALEDDLAWADLIVSAHSSVAAQAMFAGHQARQTLVGGATPRALFDVVSHWTACAHVD